ncbi:hypothetical protein KC19_6G048700 [Ceratodon purpureus]|uniref:Uncharacterized protein n=1 Tax=Ceratodon purpureus TaxID=3225 RepID=A0A8T0HBN0_CERPU|nr:hypothetical protein KC19_6G048700 [Ceratodon purpureus]
MSLLQSGALHSDELNIHMADSETGLSRLHPRLRIITVETVTFVSEVLYRTLVIRLGLLSGAHVLDCLCASGPLQSDLFLVD